MSLPKYEEGDNDPELIYGIKKSAIKESTVIDPSQKLLTMEQYVKPKQPIQQ